MRLDRLILAAATALIAVPASAAPITYSFSGTLDYDLNGTVFDNAPVLFTLTSDTDNVVQIDDNPLVFVTPETTLSFDLGGATGAFTSTFHAFATTFSFGLTLIGFSETDESDIFDVRTTTLLGYDLRSAAGPITNQPLDFLNFDTPFATSIGTLTLLDDEDDAASLTFRATLAGVPEPASWAMMIGGFGVVGGAARRRRVAFA